MAAITDLSTASSVNTSDYLVVSQSGTDKKVTANKFAIVSTTNTFADVTTFGERMQTFAGKGVHFDTGTNLWRIQQDVTGSTGVLAITRTGDADVVTFNANKSVSFADTIRLAAGKSIWFDTGTNLWRMAQDVTGATGVFKITRDGFADIMILEADGDAWFFDDVSAASYTDRTPGFEGNALEAIGKIKSYGSEVDHDTLPEFARRRKANPSTGEIEDRRDLGAMISILTVAVQELTARVAALEAGGR